MSSSYYEQRKSHQMTYYYESRVRAFAARSPNANARRSARRSLSRRGGLRHTNDTVHYRRRAHPARAPRVVKGLVHVTDDGDDGCRGGAKSSWCAEGLCATYFAPDAANPRPAGRKDCSATEDAVILFFSSSSYIAMDIMETPLPTATPMPMSAPSEMMERDVYTDWTLGMLRVREVSERVCGGARGERRSAPLRREAKKSSRGGFVCFTAQTMTFSREMRGSADAPRRLGERPRAANARERRVTSDANTSGPLERRRDARTRDPARPPSTRTWS